MANPNSTFDQILSTTLNAYRTEIVDQIFAGTRALNALKKMGVEVEQDSGAQLVTPIQYAKGAAQWMAEYDTLSLVPQDVLSGANYAWKLLGGTAVVSDLEVAQNSGRAGFIKLAKAKVKNVVETASDLLNTALFSDGSDAKMPAGLAAIASVTDPSAGALGGISRTAYPMWQGFQNSASIVLSVTDMVSGHIACTYGNSEPDLILTTQHLAASYEGLLQGKQLIANLAKADGGVSDLSFKGSPVVWDKACPAGSLYFLTTENFKIYTLEGHDFMMEAPERKIDQFVSVHKVSWFGQVCSLAPRTFGVLQNRS